MISCHIFSIRKSYLFSFIVAINLAILCAAFASGEEIPAFVPGAPAPLIADPTVFPYRVLPPAGGKRTFVPASQASTINVNFIPNGGTNVFGDACISWPAGAQTAFLYAASLWEPYLNSVVPISIEACWTSLEVGILAHGGSVDLEINFEGAPETNTFYPVALANALRGLDLEPSFDDISVAFNNILPSPYSWYFGTDGNPTVNKYDFASVALHEITHGLGFAGSMRANYASGYWTAYWGFGMGYPMPYDLYAVNGSGQSLLDTLLFPNYSNALYLQLTSNNVYFNGPNASAANGGSPVKLYAPSPWLAGSNYSHLDEIFNGTPNALMTYSLSVQEVVHDPGPVTLNILRDIGWTISGACDYSMNSGSGSFGPNGGSGTVTVTTTTGCDWTALSNNSWIHVTSGSPGNGSGTVGYSVDSFTGTGSRTGTMTIAGQTFTVTQSGCTYSLSPASQSFNYNGGANSFTVTTNGTACPWTAAETLDWVAASGSGPGTGTVNYTVGPNGVIASRSGNINVQDKSFIINQTGVLPTANFAGTPPLTGAAPFDVTFTNSSINATSWLWDFGDHFTSTLQNPTHTYLVPGVLNVSLTAINANGSNTMTINSYVTVTCINAAVRYTGLSYPNYDNSISVAYTNATTDELDIQAIDFTGPITFDQNKTVTLKGGYDCLYSEGRIPYTSISSSVTITAGAVIFDQITIK